MMEYIKDRSKIFQEEILYIQNGRLDLDEILEMLKNEIIDLTNKCYSCDDNNLKEKLKFELSKKYDLLYYFQSKKNGIGRAYLVDADVEKLPNIFLIEQKPKLFDIDEELLRGIDISKGLTYDEAYELLKWTSNNTRNNMAEVQKRSIYDDSDVYDNASLESFCGFSQFSTLYPLQKLGFDVTINNVGSMSNCRHAFGTVVIPIKEDGRVINKRFLIDCTYRQFFTIPYNCFSRYLNSKPDIGFFVTQNENESLFAKELLENGFVEANDNNLKNYLKPFYYRSFSIDELDFVDERFSEIDIIDILENEQEEFDYDEDELVSCGCNVSFPYMSSNQLT